MILAKQNGVKIPKKLADYTKGTEVPKVGIQIKKALIGPFDIPLSCYLCPSVPGEQCRGPVITG